MKVFIGIDPGSNNGFAVWSPDQSKFLVLKSFGFWEVLKQINSIADIYQVINVVIENPALNRPVFMNKDMKKIIDDAYVQLNKCARINDAGFAQGVETINTQSRILSTKAQRVGMNKQYAALLIEWCEMNSFAVLQVRPHMPKLKHEEFCELTGWDQRTNEHGRDAARLVFKLQVS